MNFKVFKSELNKQTKLKNIYNTKTIITQRHPIDKILGKKNKRLNLPY